MNIGDIFGTLRAEGSQFILDAQKAGDTAGTKAGETFSKKFGTAMRGAAGMAAGLTFATAINGATQLNELAGEYQVQTGASAEEAKAFSGVLNDLFKNAHQSYDEIAKTLIGLKTHFDLDGAAAKALAANILDFAEIAGGTGADAVERLNSLVKTGVIGQADMGITMDKLVLAHQKWGVNINETLDSLTKFAPAMNALGMSTDEAIGWMSMFNKAGVDSQRVVMGFNTAIKNFKSPEEFQAFLAKLASTPDDFERAQLASSKFGQRVGAVMANMIKPGTESVAEMATVIGTQYTDAVTKAGAINDSTFGGQALLMLHKFQGTLAEMGTNMGDLLIVFAMLGPGLTKGLLTGLGGLAGVLGPTIGAQLAAAFAGPAIQGPVLAGAKGLGTAGGLSMGTAFTAAFALAAVAAVAIAYTQIEAGLKKQADEVASQATTWAKTATDAQLEAMRKEINAKKGDIPTIFGWDVLGGKAKVQQSIDEITKEIVAREIKGLTSAEVKDKLAETGRQIGEALKGDPTAKNEATQGLLDRWGALTTLLPLIVEEADKKVVTQINDDAALIDKASKDGYVGIPNAMQAAQFEAGVAFKKGQDDLISKIKSSRSEILSAATDAADATLRPMEIAREKATLLAEMNSADLLRRLALDGGSAASQRHNLAVEELADLKAKYWKLEVEDATHGTRDQQIAKLNGLLHNQYYLDGLKSNDPDTLLYWANFEAVTQTQIDVLKGIMGTGGANAAAAWFAAFNATYTGASKTADWWTHAPGAITPPTTWTKPVQAYASGTPFVAYDQLAYVHQGEAIIPAAQNVGGGVGGVHFGDIHITGVGNDVSAGAAKRFGQTILDEVAKGLQQQGSRYSEFSGSRP